MDWWHPFYPFRAVNTDGFLVRWRSQLKGPAATKRHEGPLMKISAPQPNGEQIEEDWALQRRELKGRA